MTLLNTLLHPSYVAPVHLTHGREPGFAPVYAVVAAAGSGSRMGLAQNKQYLEIGGVPVIARCVASLQACPQIHGIVVVAAHTECRQMADVLAAASCPRLLAVTAGGASRQNSVANGLAALKELVNPPGDSPVLVHDGARCFVTAEVIERVIEGIRRLGACGAAVPVKDTIRIVDSDDRVLQTPDRGQLRAMQTPQGATWQLLESAYRQAAGQPDRLTDDLAILERAGQAVHLVRGDYANIKLTTPEDLLYGDWLADRQTL